MAKNEKREQQLSTTITLDILNEIRNGKFSGKKLLPPEQELSEVYGVSRNVIRECLTRLEREGWITRKHGVGTLINKQIVNAEPRLDLNYELIQTIRMTGKTASVGFVVHSVISADPVVAGYLQRKEESRVLRVARMIRADGKPSIYCIDYLPMDIISERYDESDLEDNIFVFLHNYCHTDVETNLAEVRAMPVTKEVSDALEVPMTTTLVYLSEVGYDLRSNPVLYSEEYFMDRVIPLTIVRKKI